MLLSGFAGGDVISPVGGIREMMWFLGQDALCELLNRLRRGFHCSRMSACRKDEDGGVVRCCAVRLRCGAVRGLAIAGDAREGYAGRPRTRRWKR